MIRTNLFDQSGARTIKEKVGCFSVIEYERDISVTPDNAQAAYFEAEMNIKKRQLIAQLSDDCGAIVQAGAMQLMIGDIDVTTDVESAGEFLKKLVGSAVTNETIIKPYYRGKGLLVLEPTYNHVILENVRDWGEGIVIEDGMFLACDDSVYYELTSRKTLSSAIFGGEGLFNTLLYGDGIVALESPVPKEELIMVELKDDILKVDGNMAVAWSSELRFTVQKSMKTLIGSAVSKEGLVNVYEGTGKVLVAPIRANRNITFPKQ